MRFSVAYCVPAALAIAFTLSPARAQSPLISAWLAANTACKSGAGDASKIQKACEKRDQISARLERKGCVHQEDGDWWKCQRGR